MRDHNESRPQAAIPEAAKSFGGDNPDSTDLATLSARADHALLLTRTIRGGKVRRRILLSLDAAERAADRVERAGYPRPTITLVRLLPVGHVDLTELRAGDDR
ncbi:hypothetical protein IGS73_07190 [Janibacter indicus]|uniref:Uncharacterized protein n=1 Tax=Janibacter indicus TaxID=857417 RepID=A0A7L9J5W9_9MICO|nr:hypothetical protein [Janibacter indicus]QOK24140.1 hypothetical protein IGS73_07190 [Janibacter indicus]